MQVPASWLLSPVLSGCYKEGSVKWTYFLLWVNDLQKWWLQQPLTINVLPDFYPLDNHHLWLKPKNTWFSAPPLQKGEEGKGRISEPGHSRALALLYHSSFHHKRSFTSRLSPTNTQSKPVAISKSFTCMKADNMPAKSSGSRERRASRQNVWHPSILLPRSEH